jgi:hypothetical protein
MSHYRPLRIFLEGSGTAEALLCKIEEDFSGWRKPDKTDSANFFAKCISTLRLLTLNLAAVAMSDRKLWVQTLSNRSWYATNSFWTEGAVSRASVEATREFLVSAGYVNYTAGTASPILKNRRPAAVQATAKFTMMVHDLGLTHRDIWRSPDQDLIQLRSKRPPRRRNRRAAHEQNNEPPPKRRLPFAWNDDLLQKAENLKRINLGLLGAELKLPVSSFELRRIMDHIATKADPEHESSESGPETTLDFTQRTLYRVFNNGSFEEGGRFYGGWWQALPKKWRSYITINGRKIVEVDYAAMHPTALSHELGLPTPTRFYEIGFGTKALVKATFNALINARGMSINAVPGFDEVEVGMSWVQFLRAVKDHYAAYRSYFGTGHGLKLQKLDSDIAEAVMLHFAGKGEVVLPVHDSFLCEQRLEAELAFVMEEEFERSTGGTVRLNAKRLSAGQRQAIRQRERHMSCSH